LFALLNGGLPVNNVKRITPAENMSADAGTYSYFSRTSGAMKSRVPARPFVVSFPFISFLVMLKPKSAIFRLRSADSKIFINFKSL
jgi:hypothetical protein